MQIKRLNRFHDNHPIKKLPNVKFITAIESSDVRIHVNTMFHNTLFSKIVITKHLPKKIMTKKHMT